jgi:hypothetical protein
VAYSPNGRFLAVAIDKHLEVGIVSSSRMNFAPVALTSAPKPDSPAR